MIDGKDLERLEFESMHDEAKYYGVSAIQLTISREVESQNAYSLNKLRNSYPDDGPVQAVNLLDVLPTAGDALLQESGVDPETAGTIMSGASLFGGNPKKALNKVDDVVEKSVRNKNKLKFDKDAVGDHTVFKRGDKGRIYKYETYEKTKTGNFNPTKRYDGGKPDGSAGTPHKKRKTGESIPTPHVQGKDVPGGVRPAQPNEIPNGY